MSATPRLAAPLALSLAATVAILLATPALALSGRSGGEGAQFLRLATGARATALGGSFAAVSDGPESLYWNPAGLSQLTRPELALSHAQYLGTLRFETITGAFPIAGLGATLGLGISYLNQDSIASVDKTGTDTGESFRPSSLALSAGYARSKRVDELKLHLGVAGKYLRESLANHAASAFALDLGLQASHDGAPGLIAAGSLRHLGSRQKFLNETAALPSELDLALAYKSGDQRHGWTASAEAALPYYADAHFKLGLEGRIGLAKMVTLAARTGLNTRTLSDLGAASALSFGLGIALERVSWDLAYQNAGELGGILHLSFGWRFGRAIKSPRPLSQLEAGMMYLAY